MTKIYICLKFVFDARHLHVYVAKGTFNAEQPGPVLMSCLVAELLEFMRNYDKLFNDCRACPEADEGFKLDLGFLSLSYFLVSFFISMRA